ncbi:MAG: SAM-dependent methyltransferase, partial [Thermoactinospora sp.]|nr:SAM-dependent methyltransferase [Thermoactinospora sp.]
MVDPLASVRAAYDAAAVRYARDIPARFHAAPLNHAMIPAFAELVR